MEMCSVSDVSGSVSVLLGSILMDCSLQHFNDLLHEKEMSLQERDKLIQNRALFLPVAGRIWQSPEQSSHTVQHIENIHSQQDKTEKDRVPTSFFERGLAPLSSSTVTSSSNPFSAAS